MTTENQTPGQEQTPAPGSPEYNEMMAAKFREAKGEENGQYPQTPEEEEKGEDKPKAPEGIPAKFIKEDGTVDVEALAKSYTELEKTRSQKPEEKPEGTPEGQQSDDDKVAAQAAEDAGLKMEDLRAKITEKGELDPSDYEAFEKAGIPRDMVDDYIALAQERVERTRTEALTYIGGQEEADALMNWAAENLTDSEIDGYNTMLNGPQWKAAVDTLKTLRNAAKPDANEPKLTSGSGSASGSTTGYTNKDDMKADMANPLYNKLGAEGEKFRAEVQRKIAFSTWRRS